MSYRVLRCRVCGRPVHQHGNGRLSNLCEHLREPLRRLTWRYLVPFEELSPELKAKAEPELEAGKTEEVSTNA